MVTLIWAPPPSSTADSPTAINYVVEYREIGDPNWYAAADRPILGSQFTSEFYDKRQRGGNKKEDFLFYGLITPQLK